VTNVVSKSVKILSHGPFEDVKERVGFENHSHFKIDLTQNSFYKENRKWLRNNDRGLVNECTGGQKNLRALRSFRAR
jgi:hypothetical protein